MNEISILATVFQNQLKLVEYRGFSLPPWQQTAKTYTEEEFLNLLARNNATTERKQRSFLTTLYETPSSDMASSDMASSDMASSTPFLSDRIDQSDSTARKLLVFYSANSSKTDTQDVKSFKAECFKHKVTDAVFITGDNLIAGAVRELEKIKMYPKPGRFQVFRDSDLMFCPIEHILTPKHERIPTDGVAPLLAALQTSTNKMPFIYSNDPIVKWYGWTVGDIIKIYRDDNTKITVKKSYQYRAVVPMEFK